MKKLLAGAALLLVSLSTSAQAATVDILLGTTSTDQTYSSGGTLNPNVNLSALTASDLTLSNAQIVAAGANSSGNYASPTGSLFGGSYLAVLGSPSTGVANFTLGNSTNTFGFTWGTVDSYNSLVLSDSRGVTYTITGADLINNLSLGNNAQEDVVVTDPLGTFLTAQLISTSNSFEAGNFSESQSSVPLPSSVTFFMMALAGLYFVYRKQQAI
jgi:hypothetical protein